MPMGPYPMMHGMPGPMMMGSGPMRGGPMGPGPMGQFMPDFGRESFRDFGERCTIPSHRDWWSNLQFSGVHTSLYTPAARIFGMHQGLPQWFIPHAGHLLYGSHANM